MIGLWVGVLYERHRPKSPRKSYEPVHDDSGHALSDDESSRDDESNTTILSGKKPRVRSKFSDPNVLLPMVEEPAEDRGQALLHGPSPLFVDGIANTTMHRKYELRDGMCWIVETKCVDPKDLNFTFIPTAGPATATMARVSINGRIRLGHAVIIIRSSDDTQPDPCKDCKFLCPVDWRTMRLTERTAEFSTDIEAVLEMTAETARRHKLLVPQLPPMTDE